MSATIAERVAAGAAFLDALEPGWDRRISLDNLDIGSSCRCILGQLHGAYSAGLLRTGLVEHMRHENPDMDEHLGFLWSSDGGQDTEIDALTAEWRRVIASRRRPERWWRKRRAGAK